MRLADALRVSRGDVITLVGGGGKTTAMFALARELVEDGLRVVTTMTTHIFLGQMKHAPAYLDLEGGETIGDSLARLLHKHRHVLVISGQAAEADKAAGVAPSVVDLLATHESVDAVIVEGDGARRLPFKAPADHEPVVPSSTTVLVPVAGLDVVGQPLRADWVHRPELVASLTGAMLGEPVSPEILAAILAHPRGGAKALPPGARLAPLLNKADTSERLGVAREVAGRLLTAAGVDSVLLGAVRNADPVQETWTRVGAVVLAAGEAKRYGALKQLLDWKGKPLVAHVANQALACSDIDRVVVTVGAGAERVRAALQGHDVQIVDVPDWQAGQSRSVLASLAALTQPSPAFGNQEPCGAVIFLLADQPGVSPPLLAALIQRHRETLAPVVAPRFGGHHGNPVLFDRATFAEFASLAGDVGARDIISAHREEIAWVDWPDASVFADIDTPQDYQPAVRE